jgi:hypothetical protein
MPSPHFKRITWKRVFSEGEKRIHEVWSQALLRASKRERPFLLAKHEAVWVLTRTSLASKNARQLNKALKEQLRLLSELYALALKEK